VDKKNQKKITPKNKNKKKDSPKKHAKNTKKNRHDKLKNYQKSLN